MLYVLLDHMPRKLSATFVRSVKPVQRVRTYGDGRGGHGLTLCVMPNGVKYWYQRIRIKDRMTNIGLGGYPVVTLAEARDAALDNLRAARAGGDPRKRRPAGVPTVAQTLEAVIRRDAPSWRNPDYTAPVWRSMLRRYAAPIMATRVDSVTGADVVALIAPLWNTKRETGVKLKTRLNAIFKLAVAEGHRADNPVDACGAALPQRRGDAQRVRKHAALPYPAVRNAIDTVDAADTWIGTKLAFRFLVLTAARSGEVRGASWTEIDLDGALWTVPANRMKAGEEHRVPLSSAAMDVLEEARGIADRTGLLFPGRRGTPIAHTTLSDLLRQLVIGAVPHGFRSSFRDWAAEQTSAPHAVMEAALAHKVTNRVEAAYFRSDLLEKRRQLMQAWADYLAPGRSASASAEGLRSAVA